MRHKARLTVQTLAETLISNRLADTSGISRKARRKAQPLLVPRRPRAYPTLKDEARARPLGQGLGESTGASGVFQSAARTDIRPAAAGRAMPWPTATPTR